MSPRLSPRLESDQLLQRIRHLVRKSERDAGRDSVELEAQRQAIDRLRSELADVVKQTERHAP